MRSGLPVAISGACPQPVVAVGFKSGKTSDSAVYTVVSKGGRAPARKMADQDDIIAGIESELRVSSRYEEFVIDRAEEDGSVWKVFLRLTESPGRLDESLEGATAWWAEPSKGSADVLSVVPEEEQLNLRFVTAPLPPAGGKIRVYPPRYLEKLLALWQDDSFAASFLRWWYGFANTNSRDTWAMPSPDGFPWLRFAQRQSFCLVTWNVSFLWGPPGTGKTTTLGAILASFIQQFPVARVLLLSTTNTAVDQALVAVDKALEELTPGQQLSPLRKSCLRIGNHFIAKNYEGRAHLLPVKDLTLVQRLMELEKERPDEADVTAYARWKAEVEFVRGQIRKQTKDALARARVAAMTTTRAVFNHEELSEQLAYDLVVFDEASQVGLSHALALVNLGKRVLFAGDPRQLAPVVQSADADAVKWLGRSPFRAMEQGARYACLLDEQSRMAKPICHVVSNAFYDGKLKVCLKKLRDPEWNREREPIHIPGLGRKHAYLIRTEHESRRSPKYGGVIRYETAELIRDLVDQLTAVVRQEDILVLTPYRAQRLLIKTFLKNANLKKVTVSTVHRAQGSERDTVIFDPVEAANSFLNNNDLGPRLMNVAISRAKARLILIASPENLRNAVLRQIANLIDGRERPRGALSLHTLVFRPDFPGCAIGKTVQVENAAHQVVCVGRVTSFDTADGKITIADFESGRDRKFSISAIRSGRRP